MCGTFDSKSAAAINKMINAIYSRAAPPELNHAPGIPWRRFKRPFLRKTLPQIKQSFYFVQSLVFFERGAFCSPHANEQNGDCCSIWCQIGGGFRHAVLAFQIERFNPCLCKYHILWRLSSRNLQDSRFFDREALIGIVLCRGLRGAFEAALA